jgi:hypothetical protein
VSRQQKAVDLILACVEEQMRNIPLMPEHNIYRAPPQAARRRNTFWRSFWWVWKIAAIAVWRAFRRNPGYRTRIFLSGLEFAAAIPVAVYQETRDGTQ